MQPYHRTRLGELYCGDCEEILPQYPDNYFDLVLTDPPYGIGEAAGKNKSRGKMAKSKDYGNKSWDNNKATLYAIEHMLRVSKEQCIWGGNYISNKLPNTSCWIVWDKENGKSDFADCELAWTSFNTAVRKFKYRWQGMLQENMKKKEDRFHPTQKPLALFKWILSNYAQNMNKVCDPYSGSGTTALACEALNKQWVCIEQDQEYCDVIVNRLQQQPKSLFFYMEAPCTH